jgi:nucleoside-diphosphate-sugar epimerase
MSILESAKTYGGSQLSRFVLLASAVAVLNSFEDTSKAGKPYTEADWNPVTLSDALSQNSPVLAYNYGKKAAEQAAWDFVNDPSCHFDMVAINPDIIIGPLIQPVRSTKNINETNEFAVYSFIDGTHKAVDVVRFPFYHFVDVRDVARAHVIAMEEAGAKGKRILQVSGMITPLLVCGIIGKRFPHLRERLPKGWDGEGDGLPEDLKPTGWDVSASSEVLSLGGKQWAFMGLEESVVDTVGSLMEWEKKWEGGS